MLMTLTSLFVVLTALRGQAVAAPATTSQAFVTKFDDLTPTKLSMVKPIPGPQDGLFFGGFTYRSDGIPQIVAKSPPNLIGFSNLRKTLGLAAPISNIRTKYPGSNVKSYRLTSAFIACSISGTSVVPPVGGISLPPPTIPQPCEIKFTATTAKGKVASQTCSYSGTSLDPALQSCFFDQTKFADVVTVVVDLESALTLTETTTVQMDDVAHTNYY
ncbi:hypothetical protein XPA_010443 [Xanthoria parietina]